MTRTMIAFVLLSAAVASPSLAQTATTPTQSKPPAKTAAAPVKKAPPVPAAFTAAKDAGDKALKENRLDDAAGGVLQGAQDQAGLDGGLVASRPHFL